MEADSLGDDMFVDGTAEPSSFVGFPAPSPVIKTSVVNKKQRTGVHAPVVTPSSPDPPPSSPSFSTFTCLLLRVDRKALPFNVYENLHGSWPALRLIKPLTLFRNIKGTVITGEIPCSESANFDLLSSTHEHQGIEYVLRRPKAPSRYMGEVSFDLTDLDDRSLLSLTPEDLQPLLSLPSGHSSNAILSIKKLYPSHTVSDPATSTFTSMRIAIECSTAVPDKVYFHQVSLPVLPYSQPPPRCFRCQRMGHGSISCRRRPACAHCASSEHTVADCDSAIKCCASCRGSHAASSVYCPFYAKAQLISNRVIMGDLSRAEAAKKYAALYPISVSRPAHRPGHVDPSSLNGTPSAVLSSLSPSPALPTRASPAFPPLWSQDSVLTPAQRLANTSHTAPKKRKLPVSPTPLHLTPEYRSILRGDSLPSSLDPLLRFADTPTSSSPPAADPSPSSPAPPSFADMISALLKQLLLHCATFLTDYLATIDSPFVAALQPLLASFVCHLTPSS